MIKNTLAQQEIQKAVGDEKKELAELYRGKARAVLTSISDADINKASLQQKSISSGVLLDKSLLLLGEATANIDVRVLLDVCQLIRDQRDKEDEAQQKQWERTHALPSPAPVVDVLPVSATPIPAATPTPARATAPIPTSAPLLPNQSAPPVAGMRIKHTSVPLHAPDSDDADDGNVLMRGLRNP